MPPDPPPQPHTGEILFIYFNLNINAPPPPLDVNIKLLLFFCLFKFYDHVASVAKNYRFTMTKCCQVSALGNFRGHVCNSNLHVEQRALPLVYTPEQNALPTTLGSTEHCSWSTHA